MSATLAPVALFAYRRPGHVRRTLTALAANPEASETDLIAFVDGPRLPSDAADVAAAIAEIRGAEGFRTVTIHERPVNLGLSASVVGGVEQVLKTHPSVIVLEDDLEVSPAFLAYMNEGLRRFAEVDEVVSIHGYVYPLRRPVPPAFLIRGADCWGWATWRRGWQVYRPDGAALLAELRERGLERAFDFDGSFPYTAMLRAHVAGQIDSWAVRWYASAFLAGKLTLYPGRSLVRNIGVDGSGTHGDLGVADQRMLGQQAPDLSGVDIREDPEGFTAFVDYFRREQRLDRKLAWQARQVRRALRRRLQERPS